MIHRLEYQLRDRHTIPALGLGTWGLRGERCTYIVKRAIELGYTHIDTAEYYTNHIEIGKALKDFDRSRIFVTSKVWPTNLQYHAVIRVCHRTLQELKTEYLDLYLIHYPNAGIPLSETLRAFNELVDGGRVKSIGVSNFNLRQLTNALTIEEHPITVNQVQFHPVSYDQQLLDYCQQHGIIVTAYSPLGHGSILRDSTLREIARKYDRTPAQICLRWGLQRGLVVIPKTSSESRLKENMALFDWEISNDDMQRVDSLNQII